MKIGGWLMALIALGLVFRVLHLYSTGESGGVTLILVFALGGGIALGLILMGVGVAIVCIKEFFDNRKKGPSSEVTTIEDNLKIGPPQASHLSPLTASQNDAMDQLAARMRARADERKKS